jgi:thioredoxin reductase (NADPH)
MDKSKFSDELPDELYPKLNGEQIARLAQVGTRRSVPAGEVLFDQGTIRRRFYVVLQGAIEAVLPSSEGEVHMRLHQPGDFTGELDMFSGRPSLVRARTVDPTEVVELDQVSLRNLVQTDPKLGEFLLRVFVRRRAAMVSRAMGDVVLIGSRYSADTLRLKEFLAHNGHPFKDFELGLDAPAEQLLQRFSLRPEDLRSILPKHAKGLALPHCAMSCESTLPRCLPLALGRGSTPHWPRTIQSRLLPDNACSLTRISSVGALRPFS